MALWIKSDNKYTAPWYSIEPDFSDIDSKITFSEAKFVKGSDGSITAFMWVTSISNLASASKVNDGGQPFRLTLHATEYDGYDWKAKAKAKLQQSQAERVLISHFGDDFDFDKCYSGHLQICSTETLLNAIESGIIPPDKSGFLKVEEIETLDKLKDMPLEATAKKSSYGGSKGQSEAERLKDRFSFLASNLGAEFAECKTADEVVVIMGNLEPEMQSLKTKTLALIDGLLNT